ncbi:MAG: TonB-dependent receptor [Acidobacteria bacterium]|nr:TonB-dependent receptor [Acidobacteriota bacterium]
MRSWIVPRVWGIALAAAAIAAVPAPAQVLYGTLLGDVTDPSGASVPGARVQLLSQQTGAATETKASGTGSYSFANVQSGVYEVNVIAAGFRAFHRANVNVGVNEVVRINVNLILGEGSQTVEVTDELPPLQSDRSDVRREIAGKELNNLPVSGYRNFQSLLGLVPGVTPPSDSNSIAGNPAGSMVANVNGASSSNNNTRVDGASNTYLWLPHLTAYVPPLESIGSVNIVTNSYDAEQGLAAGAIVSVETKSGSNQFHGSAFEYHTNSRLRARNVFNTQPGNLPKNLVNQFGGTAGGPVIHDKLFFFASYEGMRQRQNYTRLTTIPTPQHRTGNFSDVPILIYDPLTGNANGTGREAFAGNVIPAARLDSISQQLLANVPNPTYSAYAQNLLLSAPMSINRGNYDGKLNWNISDRTQLFGRYALFQYTTQDPAALGAAGGRGVASTFPGTDNGTVHSLTIGGSHVLTPAFLIDGHFGFTQQGQYGHDDFFGKNYGLDVLKIPGTNGPTINESGMPGFQISSYEGIGGYVNSSPRFRTDRQFQFSGNASYTIGAHSLRWGGEIARQQMNHYQPAGTYGPRGGFTFTGGPTALNGGIPPNQFNALAGFLLGYASNLGKSIPTSDEMRTRLYNMGFYFRDRWQVSRALTVNLGLRWEYYPMVTRDTRGVERYDWTTNQMLIGGEGSTPVSTGVTTSKALFAPRVGIAWRANQRFVIRTGYGISIDPFPLAIPLRSSYPTVIEQNAVAANSFASAGRIAAGIPLAALPDISSGVVALPATVTTLTIEQNFRRGYVQSYNFTVQGEVGHGFVAQAGYVGSRTIRLTNRRDLNAAILPGTGAAGRPYFTAFGRTVATTLHEPAYTSAYDSLQLRIDRRFLNGLGMGVAYTFSKALGYGENNDSSLYFNSPLVLDRNRSRLNFDRPHNLRISGVYELPFGRTKPFARSGLAAVLFGGWQINGILSIYSGTSFTVSSSAASLNSPGNSQVADQIVSAVAMLGGTGPGQSWFDPLAFRAITTARYGSAGLNILRGPGIANLDLGVFRSFRITERVSMQFRSEAFNSTNTPHFNNPGANASNMVLNSDGTIRTLGGYTEITSAAADERQFRFALRLSF